MGDLGTNPVCLRDAAGFHIWRQQVVDTMGFAHSHADIEGLFLLEGAITYAIGGRSVTVPAGQLVWFWGGFPHQVLSSDHVDGVWITLPLEQWFAWKLPAEITESLFHGNFVAGPGEEFTAATLLRWAADIQTGRKERKEAALLEIHAGVLRFASSGSALPLRDIELGSRSLEKALVWIHRHYRENITSEQVADAVGVHPKYLMRMFRNQLSITLWEYVTQQRLAHAQRMLLSTDCTVLDAALAAGFQSPAPFYQAFRKQMPGQTPSGFRRKKDSFRTGDARE